MAETYASDDLLNLTTDHILRALQADPDLGAGGDLAIKTWNHTLPADAGVYQANLLPAVAAEVDAMSPATDEGFPDLADMNFEATVVVVVGGGELAPVKRNALKYAARIYRVLEQQHHPDKQLDGLPAVMDGARPGSVRVRVTALAGGATKLENTSGLRGIAEIQATITVEIVVPTDN